MKPGIRRSKWSGTLKASLRKVPSTRHRRTVERRYIRTILGNPQQEV
jgi:hypothetical protein